MASSEASDFFSLAPRFIVGLRGERFPQPGSPGLPSGFSSSQGKKGVETPSIIFPSSYPAVNDWARENLQEAERTRLEKICMRPNELG
jgi:hypothetical protein